MTLTTFEGIHKRESTRKQSNPQRSMKMEDTHNTEIGRKSSSRKQSSPQRSLKQLSSVVEQVIDGHITISPIMPWEITTDLLEYCNRNDYTPVSASFLTKSELYSDNYDAVLDCDAACDIESAASLISSIKSSKEIINKSKTTKKAIVKPQTFSGKILPEDVEAKGVAHRKKIWERMMNKRRSTHGSGGGGGGSTSVGSARGVTPLDISDYAGASLLDDDEFQLCSSLRLFPIQYFQSRKTLVGNYEKIGFYKKSAAQKMLKIDVNKTGKLYDFFTDRQWMPLAPDDATIAIEDERWLEIE